MKQTDNSDVDYSFYTEIETKQKELDSYLIKLSDLYDETDRDKVLEIGKKICAIYESKLSNGVHFRHQYNHFLRVLWPIEPDCVDVLTGNLKIIIEDNKGNQQVCYNLLKLYDHISIDIVRMNTIEQTENVTRNFKNTSEWINAISKKSNDLKNEINDLSKKMDSSHIEIVAVLGVFAAIVIGFTGGLDIIGGALSNVGVKDFPLILFSVSLCGMVLFDLLWLLMECVMHITKGSGECVIGYYPVLIFNVMMIVLMIIAFFWNNI